MFEVVAGDQDVRGLDVAVHEAATVRRIERRADLRHDPRRTGRVESTLLLYQRSEVGPLDEAHRDEQPAIRLSRFVDGQHVGVVDRRRELGLALEARPEIRLAGEIGRDHLQRHRAVQADVRRPVHDAHAALTDDALDPVPRELGALAQHRHGTDVLRPDMPRLIPGRG